MAVLLVAGCGGPKPGFDAGAVALGELGGRVAGAVCACLLRTDGGARYCSQADCEAAYPQLGLSTLEGEVDAGWLRYDAHAAAACLADGGPFCFPSTTGLFPPSIEAILGRACPAALTGARGAGGSCLSDFDCDAGSCFSDAGACVGACSPPLPAGVPCALAGIPCAEPLSCLGGRCAGPPKPGDPCHTLGQTGECGALLWCHLDAGVCAAWASAGQSCEWHGGALDPPCAPPAWCDQWSRPGTCRLPSDAGGPCLTLDDDGDCAAPLTCLPSDGGPGAGICGAPIHDGGACAGFGCVAGLVCTKGICAPPPGAGAACLASGGIDALAGQCAADLVCGAYVDAGGFCGPAACLEHGCAIGSAACSDGVCSGGSCVAPALGMPCGADSDCASGDCVDGGCADPYACTP